jgi:hypothetical protein
MTSYAWDFGDGSSTVTGAKPTNHTYSTADNYTVTLTVTDSLNRTDSATHQITIATQPASAPLAQPDNSAPSEPALEPDALPYRTYLPLFIRVGSSRTISLRPVSGEAPVVGWLPALRSAGRQVAALPSSYILPPLVLQRSLRPRLH